MEIIKVLKLFILCHWPSFFKVWKIVAIFFSSLSPLDSIIFLIDDESCLKLDLQTFIVFIFVDIIAFIIFTPYLNVSHSTLLFRACLLSVSILHCKLGKEKKWWMWVFTYMENSTYLKQTEMQIMMAVNGHPYVRTTKTMNINCYILKKLHIQKK